MLNLDSFIGLLVIIYAYVFLMQENQSMMKNLSALIIVLIGFATVVVAAARMFLTPIRDELLKQNICHIGDAFCTLSLGIIILIAIIGVPILLIAIIGVVIHKAWSDRHGLDIFYKNDDPMCHHFNKDSVNAKSCYFTRLIITNESNNPAVDCKGRLETIIDEKGIACSDWFNSDLYWERQWKPAGITLDPNGGNKPLDIGWVNEGEDVFKIRTDQSSQGIVTHRPRGTYYFLVAVTAADFRTVKQWFKVTWLGDYSDFKMKTVRNSLKRI